MLIPRTNALRWLVKVIAGLALVIGLAGPSHGYERPGRTEWVSVTYDGKPPQRGPLNGEFWGTPVMSANGRYVVFTSDVQNIVRRRVGGADVPTAPADGPFMVYRRDMELGRTEPVSVDSLENWPIPGCLIDASINPSVSSDGRFVAFSSCAPNLVPGDTNLANDVFVRDVKSGTTIRASVSSNGGEAEGPSYTEPGAMAPDGHHVTFASIADDLVKRDRNYLEEDVFIRCFRLCEKGEGTELVTVSSDEDQGRPHGLVDCLLLEPTQPNPNCLLDLPKNSGFCNEATGAAVSANGRYVAFSSPLHGLVDNDSGGSNVFLRDRKAGTTSLVDVSTDGGPPGPPGPCLGSSRPAISNDGRFVSFTSSAMNLVPRDTEGLVSNDIFVRDMARGRTTRVSVSSFGEEGSSEQHPATGVIAEGSDISNNGRLVTFMSSADNYGPPDPKDGGYDVFVHDRETGAIVLISAPPRGRPHRRSSIGSQVGVVNGRYAAFKSRAPGLVAGDKDPKTFDFFRRDWGSQLMTGYLVASGSDAVALRSQSGISAGRACARSDGCRHTLFWRDRTNDVSDLATSQGANVYGASLAYRPRSSDLFVTIELDHMPQVGPVASPIVHGIRFQVGSRAYEARSGSLFGGTFGLFDCTSVCRKVRDLRGGYGTTGERIVFSIPLGTLGRGHNVELVNVNVYAALGSFDTGATRVLDTLQFN